MLTIKNKLIVILLIIIGLIQVALCEVGKDSSNITTEQDELVFAHIVSEINV